MLFQIFLKYFITFLIEAVGGYKDFEQVDDRREGLERSWDDNESRTSEDSEDDIEDKDLDSPQDETMVKSTPEEGFNEGEIFAFEEGPNSTVNLP